MNTNCQTCGEQFVTKPSRLSKGQDKYCSRKCIPIPEIVIGDNATTRPCKKCGKEFAVASENGLKDRRRRFCSDACRPRRDTTARLRWEQEWRSADPSRIARYARTHRQRLKAAVLVLLGDCCKRCGFKDSRALQIDHVNGGGSRHHKKVGSGGVLKAVLDNPKNFQILCANCNWIKKAETPREQPFSKYKNPVEVSEEQGPKLLN